MGLNIKRVKEHILLSLGAGKVGLEIDDAHVNEGIRFGIEMLNTFLGWDEQFGAVLTPSSSDRERGRRDLGSCDKPSFTAELDGNETSTQSALCTTLQLPSDVLYVSEVYYSTEFYPFGIEFSRFNFLPAIALYNRNISHTQFYQFLTWIEETNKLYGFDPKWELLQGHVLRLDPWPGPGKVVVYKYTPLYNVDVNIFDNADVQANMGSNIPKSELYFQLWIQRWALAHVKEILSRTRGKFSAYPSGEETVELDGPVLAAEAAAEKTALKEELSSMSIPAGVFLL